MTIKAKLTSIGFALAALMAVGTVYDGFFVTQTGHLSIVKRAGDALPDPRHPGMHFKIPFVDVVEHINVQERKSAETMDASTSEQMKAVAKVSVNWRPDKQFIRDLYVEYGSIKKFEDTVIDPKLRESAKIAIAKFTAEENITDRSKASNVFRETFKEKVSSLPILVSDTQIEELVFSQQYVNSIEAKQTELQNVQKQRYSLEKQDLKAKEREQTAKASANAKLAIAKAEAQSIALVGKANADAIRQQAKALSSNPDYIDLVKWQQWNGSFITTGVTSGSSMIVDARDNVKKQLPLK